MNMISQKPVLTSLYILSWVSVGFGFYKALTSNQRREKGNGDQYEGQQAQITKSLDNLNNLQALLSKKSQEIEIKYLSNAPHILAPDCLKDILEFTPTIIDAEQLEKIYSNNRKARRTCFSAMRASLGQGPHPSLQTYYRFVCTFEEQLQYLIEKSQKDFVVFLNIEYSTIIDSIEFLNTQEDIDFSSWIKEWSERIKQQLKNKLPLYENPLPLSLILDIAQFQIQALNEENENLKKSIVDLNLQTMDEQEAIPAYLQAFLEDLIFEKFNVQIQQVNLEPEHLTPEDSQKFLVLSKMRDAVLRGMLYLDDDFEVDASSDELTD